MGDIRLTSTGRASRYPFTWIPLHDNTDMDRIISYRITREIPVAIIPFDVIEAVDHIDPEDLELLGNQRTETIECTYSICDDGVTVKLTDVKPMLDEYWEFSERTHDYITRLIERYHPVKMEGEWL